MSAPMAGPGADLLLGNRYRLLDRIAGGGMGEVWRALDEVLGREVAVKILRREYAEDPTFLQRFRAEARHSANLAHPGIAAVYDFGEGSADAGASPFLVMENVPGEPLSDLIGREGELGPDRTLDIVGQAALALQAAHDAGVIHRDVKPGNILVTPTGAVKITDFGIARATNSVPLTQTGAIMGTAHYLSPEQASGSAVTPASDIYSLGIVAYECLTGQRPFTGDTPVSVALAQVRDDPPALPATVPAPVRALVMRMLAKEPEQRPADAGMVGAQALALRPALTTGTGQDPATRVLPVSAGLPVDLPYAGAGAATATPVAGAAPVPRHHADTDPGFHLPTPARRPSWLPYVVALVLFGLLFLALRACDSSPGTVGTVEDSPGSSSESSPVATAPATVDVAAQDYLGRPVGEVRSELTDLGLRVAVDRSVGDGDVDTVQNVAPTGTLQVGREVRLEVVAAPPPGEDEAEEGDEDGPGKGGDKGKSGDKGKGNGEREDD